MRLDAGIVAPDDEESNYRMVHERLVVPGAEIHRCRGELGPDAAAAEYADALRDVVLDVALLGMGPDGHTASLFPGNEALRAEGIAAGVRNAPKPPPERVTLTLPYLNSARRIVLLTTGEAKAPALARVVAGPDEATPSSLRARDRLEIVADEAALSGSAVRG